MLRIFLLVLFLCSFVSDDFYLAKKHVIVIDPGHGGIDNGAQSDSRKFIEKNFSLLYAKTLFEALNKYPDYQVILTRDEDIALSHETRKKIASDYKADLFISIHADYSNDKNLFGASVYTLSQDAIVLAKDTLIKKNNLTIKDDIKFHQTDNEISKIMLDIIYHQSKNQSVNIAQIVYNELQKEVNVINKAHRFAELKILKNIDIPAFLIEIGYLSNEQDLRNLADYGYRYRLIASLVRAINQYFISQK